MKIFKIALKAKKWKLSKWAEIDIKSHTSPPGYKNVKFVNFVLKLWKFIWWLNLGKMIYIDRWINFHNFGQKSTNLLFLSSGGFIYNLTTFVFWPFKVIFKKLKMARILSYWTDLAQIFFWVLLTHRQLVLSAKVDQSKKYFLGPP